MSPCLRIGFLTSWEERCGVADYSRLLVDELRRLDLAVEVVPAAFGTHPARHYEDLARRLAACDLAHVQFTYAFFGGLHPRRTGWPAFARELHGPAVITAHEVDDGSSRHGPLAPAERAWIRSLNRRIFRHPALRHWVVHAEPLADALRGVGVPRDALTCTPLPLALPTAAPLDPEAVRRRLGLEGRRLLVMPGFLARRKGYEVALQALSLLPSEWVLVAAGGEHAADRSGMAAALRELAGRLGVGERFRITGYLPEAELSGLLASADLIPAPFLEVSASASVNLALAHGRVVIASDLPALRATGCVALIPPGDAAALAATIRGLQENPGWCAELAMAARGYASRHSYAGLAAETARLYRAVLENPVRNTDR